MNGRVYIWVMFKAIGRFQDGETPSYIQIKSTLSGERIDVAQLRV